MKDEVWKISVSGQAVGIAGLGEIFSRAKEKGLGSIDAERFLLGEMKKKNYVPPKTEGQYGLSLMRAYRKFLGEKVEEEAASLEVRVLGAGCANCQKLERETLAALDELGLAADFDHVPDLSKIADYRVLGLPALVINGRVKSVGRIPARGQIKKWLLEEGQEK